MNYNTLKASYPTKAPYPTTAPYPKEKLGLIGNDCKQLGVAPGDGTSGGYRIFNNPKVPKDSIYYDTDKYPFTDAEKWLNAGGGCNSKGEKYICSILTQKREGSGSIYTPPSPGHWHEPVYTGIDIYRCQSSPCSNDRQNSKTDRFADFTLPQCLNWLYLKDRYWDYDWVCDTCYDFKMYQSCQPCTPDICPTRVPTSVPSRVPSN